MKKARLGLLPLILLLLFALPLGALGEEALHEYLGIPFQTATADSVAQTLLAERGAVLEASDKALEATAEAVSEFGYDWHLQVDFNEGCPGINRILLSSAQDARVEPEAWDERVRADLEEFLAVEAQMTALYGESDFRYLLSPDIQAAEAFPDGLWTRDAMEAVLEKHGTLRAFTVWGNVNLGTWMDRVHKPYAQGKHLSRLMLEYRPEAGTRPDREQGMLR